MKARIIDLCLYAVFSLLVAVAFYLSSHWDDKALLYKLIYEGL